MTTARRSAVLGFVLLLGTVNLFADFTYEGGRSIIGPFLAQLGATAATVSIISGVGEFFGYTLRAGAGYLADRTRRYWLLTVVGYAINLLAVPALALAGHWIPAACLIAAERTGRAIRRPIVQGMLSHAKEDVGSGRAFGINESLDALGATIGPLVIASVIASKRTYRAGFGVLVVPAVIALILLVLAQRRYPFADATVTVTHCGRICFHGRKINLSHVFAGQNVGVTQVGDRIWLVTFMHYDLGYFDDEAGRVEPIENPFGSKVLPMCSE